MNYHFSHGFFHGDFVSRRALAFSGIAAFHILIAYLLLTALVQPPAIQETRIASGVTDEVVDHVPPPVIPDFRPHNRTVPIPVPDPGPVELPQGPTGVTAVVPDGAVAGPGSDIPVLPVRVLGINQLPNSEDYYPPDLRRENVQGATNVRVCVNEQGVRKGDPMVEASSGNARLDMGAVNVARHGRYARSVQGTTPVPNCFRFKIAFKIAH